MENNCYSSSKKVLLLGISYPDVEGHMKAHNYDMEILQHQDGSVDQAVECVRRKILTEMDGRDLARVVATENVGDGYEAYTVSKEMGGIYKENRHVYASFNNSRSMRKAMAKAFGTVQFQQVILDYYWMPTGWLVTRWAKTLFQETLPDLVKYNLLAYPSNRSRSPRKNKRDNNNSSNTNKDSMGLEEGVVFLPFCAHVCKELVGGIDILAKYYAITFVKKNELPGHALWKGTMEIDGKIMQERLGKRLDQEEIYCTFNPKDIYESMEDAHVNKDEVMEMLLSIEDYENIRMIRLRPLKQHEPPSLFKDVATKTAPEKGGFMGLNHKMGRKRFLEYKRRKGPQTVAVAVVEPKKTKKKVATRTRKVKQPVVSETDSDSDVQTVNGSEDEIDYDIEDSDSSSDEESTATNLDSDDENDNENTTSDLPADAKDFDPNDPDLIPETTHYYPYPALDLESYMISKDIVEQDKVMAFYAKRWGPKLSRKKNKRQDIAKLDYKRFQKTQRDYMMSNPRLPPRSSSRDPKDVYENDGVYQWTLVGSDDDEDNETFHNNSDSDDSERGNGRLRKNDFCGDTHGKRGGWMVTRKGDDPDAHLMPKIIAGAKRDHEMMACRHLFEMKNPGFKQHSRTWINNSSFLSCYQIPRGSVLIKMETARKAKKKLEASEEAESQKAGRKRRVTQQQQQYHFDDDECYDCDDEQDDYLEVAATTRGADEPSTLSSPLFGFANVAATTPLLSEDCRRLCKASKNNRFGIAATSIPDEESVLQPFKPTFRSQHLSYDLSPHNTNFPRELFRLLQDAEDQILDHILSWQKHGRSFIVKDHEEFEKVILKNTRNGSTSTTTYDSFVRTLLSYGFSEIKIGKRKGGYRHNLFQQGKPKRLEQLIREGPVTLSPANDEGGGAADKSLATKNVNVEESPPSTSVPKSNARQLFIENLYQLLRQAKSLGLNDAIHWEEDGKSFRVHKLTEKFTKDVLNKYLSMPDYKNFKKELLDRKFKCKEGVKYGIFEHPRFAKGKRGISDTFKDVRYKYKTPKAQKQKETKGALSSSTSKEVTVSQSSTSRAADRSGVCISSSKKTTAARSKVRTKRYDTSSITYFPRALRKILEDSDKKGFSDIIRWMPNGTDIFMAKDSLVESKFLCNYTRIKTFATFEKKLLLCGFQKSTGPDGGSIFTNPTFVRGQCDSPSPKNGGRDETKNGIDYPKYALASPNSDVVRIDSHPATLQTSGQNNATISAATISIASSMRTQPDEISATTFESPGVSRERQLFPLSPVTMPKSLSTTTAPKHQSNGDGTENIVPTNGSKRKAGSKKPMGRPRKKKRKVASKLSMNVKVPRNSTGTRPRGKRKNVINARKPSRTLRSDVASVSDISHDRSMASPRALRSSNKVCGIDLIDPRTRDITYLSSFGNISKSYPGSVYQMMNVSQTPLPDQFAKDNLNLSTIVSSTSAKDANSTRSTIITPTQEMAEDGTIRRTAQGAEVLERIIFAFSSMVGKDRAEGLRFIFLLRDSLEQMSEHHSIIAKAVRLALLHSPSSNTDRVRYHLDFCLLFENCGQELVRMFGHNWFQCQSLDALQEIVHRICLHKPTISQVTSVRERLVDVIREHDVQQLESEIESLNQSRRRWLVEQEAMAIHEHKSRNPNPFEQLFQYRCNGATNNEYMHYQNYGKQSIPQNFSFQQLFHLSMTTVKIKQRRAELEQMLQQRV